jgi:hypothetical protein
MQSESNGAPQGQTLRRSQKTFQDIEKIGSGVRAHHNTRNMFCDCECIARPDALACTHLTLCALPTDLLSTAGLWHSVQGEMERHWHICCAESSASAR